MAAHYFKDHKGYVIRSHCADIYFYNGFYFEWHDYTGPKPVKKSDYSIRKSIPRPEKDYWNAIRDFGKLTKKQRRKYLVME